MSFDPWLMDDHYHPQQKLWPSPYATSPYGSLPSVIEAMERRMQLFERHLDHLMGRPADYRMQPWSSLKKFPKGLEVTKTDNGRKLNLELDMNHFNPEDIKVTLKDQALVVHAKREDHDGHGGRSFQHYYRRYPLPEDVKMDTFKSLLSKEGLLKIEAELPPALEAPKSEEVVIPMTWEKKQ